MIYRQFLVMRKAVGIYVGSFFALLFLWMLYATISFGRDGTSGPLTELLPMAGWLTAFFGAAYGAGLGSGAREASRVLWVMPVPRWRSAMEIVAVDLAGMIVSFFGLIAAFVASFAVLAPFHHATLDITWSLDPVRTIMWLGFAFAVYGWSAMAGMIVRRVPYVGIAVLPLFLFWDFLADGANSFSAFLRTIIVANPFSLVAYSDLPTNSPHSLLVQHLSWLTPPTVVELLAVIIIATVGLATVLWQRAQVLA